VSLFAACEQDAFLNGALDTYVYKMYPGASNLEWKKQHNYYVAMFRNEGCYNEAWYDTHGKWYMTAITTPYINLPEIIRDGLIAAGFPEKNLETKINTIKRIKYDFISERYVINIKQDKNINYFFTYTGFLFGSTADNDFLNPIVLPEKVKDDLAERYAKNLIYDAQKPKDTVNDLLDVMMLIQNTEQKMIVKYQNDEWNMSLKRISMAEIPVVVRLKLDEYMREKYENETEWNVLDIYSLLTNQHTEDPLYYFEIIIRQETIGVLIDSEGKLIDLP
jgi:hypothetical protein